MRIVFVAAPLQGHVLPLWPATDLAGDRSHLAGTEHQIVYDPDDPQRAAIPGGRTGTLIGSFTVGLVFLGFAGLAYRLAGPLLNGHDSFGMP